MTEKDFTWGTGLDRIDPEKTDPSQWPGDNMLGRALTRLRAILANLLQLQQLSAALAAQEGCIIEGDAEDNAEIEGDAEDIAENEMSIDQVAIA